MGEVLQRFAAVVEHAHGQGQVEVARGDVVEGQRQIGAVLRAEQFFQGEVLREVVPGGVEAEGEARARAEHAVEEVAVAAADVEDVLAGETHAGGEQAGEFVVAAPFAVDVDAVEIERAFAPRHQRAQSRFR